MTEKFSEAAANMKAKYRPHRCHAMIKGQDGTYPWTLGVRKSRAQVGHLTNVSKTLAEAEGDVQVLEGADLDRYLGGGQSQMGPGQSGLGDTSIGLIPVRPRVEWDAVVTSTSESGDTVGLDIEVPGRGVTLHYLNVPVVGGKGTWEGHTCVLITEKKDRDSRDESGSVEWEPEEGPQAREVPGDHENNI